MCCIWCTTVLFPAAGQVKVAAAASRPPQPRILAYGENSASRSSEAEMQNPASNVHKKRKASSICLILSLVILLDCRNAECVKTGKTGLSTRRYLVYF